MMTFAQPNITQLHSAVLEESRTRLHYPRGCWKVQGNHSPDRIWRCSSRGWCRANPRSRWSLPCHRRSLAFSTAPRTRSPAPRRPAWSSCSWRTSFHVGVGKQGLKTAFPRELRSYDPRISWQLDVMAIGCVDGRAAPPPSPQYWTYVNPEIYYYYFHWDNNSRTLLM